MTDTTTAVIPAFNEAGRIADVIAGVLPHVDEVLVVDDASTDDTASVARAAGARVLRQSANGGYIAAIKAGFRQARGDIVITLDADGEFSPHYIPQLIAPIRAGRADMVQGHRDVVPRPSERFLSWLAGLKGPVGDSGTGLRALRTDLARSLRIEGACICGVLGLEVLQHGGRIVEIPIALKTVSKPRRIAWFHVRQFFHVLRWLPAKLRS
jgi:polyprenyl-phospho-N-acetylgalactosaminyl synthase